VQIFYPEKYEEILYARFLIRSTLKVKMRALFFVLVLDKFPASFPPL